MSNKSGDSQPIPDNLPPVSLVDYVFNSNLGEGTPPGPFPWEWHRPADPQLRKGLVIALVQAINPKVQRQDPVDARLISLVEYARRLEEEAFRKTDFLGYYIHLMRMNILNFEEERAANGGKQRSSL